MKTFNSIIFFIFCVSTGYSASAFSVQTNDTTPGKSNTDSLVDRKFVTKAGVCDVPNSLNGTLRLNATIVPGRTVFLNASLASSYQWSPAEGLSCYTCKSPMARVYHSTEYLVTLIDSNDCQWVEKFRITNRCDTSYVTFPKIVFDSLAYPGENVVLTAPAGLQFSWQTPTTGLSCIDCQNPAVTITNPVSYQVTLTDSFSCVSRLQYKFRIRDCSLLESPNPIVKQDVLIHYPTKVKLEPSQSSQGYSWTPVTGLSCSDCRNPEVEIDSTIQYTVILSDPWQCPYPEIFKFTMEDFRIVVPNVFTPNGDGINDCFEIQGLVSPSVLKIMDVKGAVVYSSPDYQNTWCGKDGNGKELKEDTYWYLLTIPTNGKFKGWVYLKK